MTGRGHRLELDILTAALMFAALCMVLVHVPTEAERGIVQRIFDLPFPARG